jgi:hypothetical protein
MAYDAFTALLLRQNIALLEALKQLIRVETTQGVTDHDFECAIEQAEAAILLAEKKVKQ